MKNDKNFIKNDLLDKENKHQKLLKNNLRNEIIKLLEKDGKTFLYVLENKQDIILNVIKITQELEQVDSKDKDELVNNSDVILSDDYNYLYDSFFSIYSNIEKEEKKKQELIYEKRQKFIVKLLTNLIKTSIDGASEQGVSKSLSALKLRESDARQLLCGFIRKDFEEENFTDDELNDAYDKVLEKFLNEYKYDKLEESDTEAEEEDGVKLHWIWKANIILDAINEFFKNF